MELNRRTVLGATASSVLVAGCLGGDDDPTANGEDSSAADDDEGDHDAGGGDDRERVVVGPDGDPVFDPEELTVEPGTTVVFEWESDAHTVTPESQPDDADWEGHPDTEHTDHEHAFTFEVDGRYEYYCEPHRSAGMEGVIVVEEGGADRPTVGIRSVDEFGDVLVGPEESTLYAFDRDSQGESESACYDDCEENWPPLTVDDEPTADDDVTADLTTFEREGGDLQVAADGWPLYHFVGDEEPGDVEGQGANDVWWVLEPDGTPIRDDDGSGDESDGGGGGDGGDGVGY